MTTNRKQFYASLLERVLWTFFQALGGAYIMDGIVNVSGLDNGDKFKAALIAAGISVVKNLFGGAIGNGSTPSWLPTNLDPATPPVASPGVNAVTNTPVAGDHGEINLVVVCVVFVAIVVVLALLGVVNL